jgi:hypothetical protein
VTLALSATDQAALSALERRLAPLSAATSQSLLAAHSVQFQSELGYDPQAAAGLELIQSSALALTPEELTTLGANGFAVSKAHLFPNMAYGLKTIYAHDLPLYISIDPILDAVHNAYDKLLSSLESSVLRSDLELVLKGALERNAAGTQGLEARKDLDLYFSVALSLLRGEPVAPSGGADRETVETLVRMAREAKGITNVSLFGVARELDFTQFTPRGHYADSNNPYLQQYFRAMIWLGRTDFRLIETQPDGQRVFHRRQLMATLALRDAVSGVLDPYRRVDEAISVFAGEHDYMQLAELDALLAELGPDPALLPDQQIAQTIIDRGYGAQRISSQVKYKDRSTEEITLPLDRSFAFFGQRYSVDSHVFSEVTYDRVLRHDGNIRLLPSSLDAAYAALGNDAALPLLVDELDKYAYAPQLESMRTLIDAHAPDLWQDNLYNLWLSTLRALSPSAAQLDELPTVARTEAWSRRVLSTQLASWAQLRHDTVAYTKQSYTLIPTCEFPDVYVDPYPEAFARLALFAHKGRELLAKIRNGQNAASLEHGTSYFKELESVANILRDMAEQQRAGTPFSAEQMAFVNQAVNDDILGCGGPKAYSGWYARLMYEKEDPGMNAVIADVHTDPGDTERPGQVLHAAAGLPRLMVVTVDTCNGPRAYAGLASTFHELVTDDVKRLTDAEWALQAPTATDVPWLAPR